VIKTEDIKYIVYCYQCQKIVATAATQKDAQKKSTEHLMNPPHMLVSVLDRREAEERGVVWLGKAKSAGE
jgi:hypothetical protein